jgi:hypothetical protein
MLEIGRRMRLFLRVPATIFGSLGVCVVAGFVAQDDRYKWHYVLIFSTALLLPAVLYLFTLARYLRSEAQERDLTIPAGASPGAFPLMLSVALYLPCMILMLSSDGELKFLPEQITISIARFIPLFLILWIFCACSNQWLRGDRSVVLPKNGRLHGALHWCLRMTGHFLSSPVLLFLGVALLACSLWTGNDASNLLKGQETWITAEFGLGERISAANLFLRYFGRFVYGASLLLAACSVVLLSVCRFSNTRLRVSRAAAVVGLATAFLAICSITDYYFSWQSFLLDEHLPAMQWILFLMLFLHWLVPVFLAVGVFRAGREEEGPARLVLRTVVLFYAPLLLFDLAMTPFFVEDSSFLFILVSFLGLQFLAWGYLQLATLPREQPARGLETA